MPPKRKPPTTDQFLRTLGERVHTQRVSKGWTLQQLATAAHTSKSQIFYLERGCRAPTVRTMHRIAEALNRPVTHFFDP